MPRVLQDRGTDNEGTALKRRKKRTEGTHRKNSATERSGKMSLSVFEFKEEVPDDAVLAKVLGATKGIWDDVREHIEKNYKDMNEEWKYYSRSSGWLLVVRSGKRTLIYLIPMSGYFKTNFVFGESAVNAALASGLPADVIKKIAEARPYVEGRSFMVDVKKTEDTDTVRKLIAIKDEN